MGKKRTYTIPRKLPGYVEVADGQFQSCETLTADQWRAARQFEDEYWRRRVVNRMVNLAKVFRVPGETVLLPYLQSLASGKEVLNEADMAYLKLLAAPDDGVRH